MAIQVWTPDMGFTRKSKPVAMPTVKRESRKQEAKPETPKPVEVKRPKRVKPSRLAKQKAYWLKTNRLPAQRTVADAYLIKQARLGVPMVFVGYGRVYHGVIKSVWRYFLRVFVNDRLVTTYKLNLSLYYKAEDAPAVEAMLSFDESGVMDRPHRKLSERDSVNLDAVQSGATVSLILRTGHSLTGVVRWVSRYDVGLTLPNGGKVHCFKHSIVEC